ncbi:MAG: RNA polymerase sigma factor [Polyangiaceae bacterium]|nr:RNA polymerase sigma factor [Polyangiaceae bacterium]
MARRVAAGDAAAFRAIVEHTQVRLYRVAARVLGDLAEAEDAVQEAYVKAYQALTAGRYDGRAEIGTWLYRIVTNCCLDALRRRAAGARAAERAPRFAESASAEARVALRELDARLATLPPPQRVAVVLTAVEGLSTREAAEVLGCTEGAVEQRLQRARGALRAEGRDEGSRDG